MKSVQVLMVPTEAYALLPLPPASRGDQKVENGLKGYLSGRLHRILKGRAVRPKRGVYKLGPLRGHQKNGPL